MMRMVFIFVFLFNTHLFVQIASLLVTLISSTYTLASFSFLYNHVLQVKIQK